MSDPDQRMQQRYGAPRRGRRIALIAAVTVLGVAALAWVAWAALYHASPKVESSMISFTAADEHRATARFTVERSEPDTRASCLLRATAADHSIVGELRFPVGPGEPTTTTVTKSLRTERAATSVELLGCTAPGQNDPR